MTTVSNRHRAAGAEYLRWLLIVAPVLFAPLLLWPIVRQNDWYRFAGMTGAFHLLILVQVGYTSWWIWRSVWQAEASPAAVEPARLIVFRRRTAPTPPPGMGAIPQLPRNSLRASDSTTGSKIAGRRFSRVAAGGGATDMKPAARVIWQGPRKERR